MPKEPLQIAARGDVMPDHGLILDADDFDYRDMKKFGRITIEETAQGIAVVVSGFEFERQGTCRQTCSKALAWGRDILQAALRADVLVPGGTIKTIAD